MTMREQVALALSLGIPFVLGILWAVDVVSEMWEDYQSRERTWRSIEVRCSRERHPSYQVPVYDWAKEVE